MMLRDIDQMCGEVSNNLCNMSNRNYKLSIQICI